ncbi:hypothetical protein F2P81_016287 [Scophthalmus maximus]|uniref:Uncharacterized protein n=1 Tax=Scophthalmus maximus TaxID=52904 RepID=A0A6A4SN58_SCOMX|nr:hypothetical protein F2P81_016287 [Scophthalmus maximus]
MLSLLVKVVKRSTQRQFSPIHFSSPPHDSSHESLEKPDLLGKVLEYITSDNMLTIIIEIGLTYCVLTHLVEHDIDVGDAVPINSTSSQLLKNVSSWKQSVDWEDDTWPPDQETESVSSLVEDESRLR